MKKLIKTTAILALFLYLILPAGKIKAQNQVLSYPFDINGIDISKQYNKQQIIAFFGEPTSYNAVYYKDVDSFDERYTWGKDELYCANGYFTRILLADTKFSFFNGYLKVGDHISKLNNFTNKEIFRLVQNPDTTDNRYTLDIYENSMEVYYDKNNIIVFLFYNVPD